jgi:hypothetical protein
VRLDVEPLLHAWRLDQGDMEMSLVSLSRAIGYDFRSDRYWGTISIDLADRIAIGYLRRLPWTIWGEDWWRAVRWAGIEEAKAHMRRKASADRKRARAAIYRREKRAAERAARSA